MGLARAALNLSGEEAAEALRDGAPNPNGETIEDRKAYEQPQPATFEQPYPARD